MPIPTYVNTVVNKLKRQMFAQELIRVLEKGKIVWNLDESSFHKSSPWSKGWVQKGTKARTMRTRVFQNITLTSVVMPDGSHYYTLLKGSNNEWTFAKFIRLFVGHMDQMSPRWRESTILLMDNVGLHKTPYVMETIRSLNIPAMYSGPGSFSAIPVELVFSRIKREFSMEFNKKTAGLSADEAVCMEGSLSQNVIECIVKGINNVKANTIKQAYILQL